MKDEYFGVKQLREAVLRAKTPMQFGSRALEAGEPLLYFQNVNFSSISERSSPIMARGGWGNQPHVIWEQRSQIQFSLSEGVMSSVSMGILLSANVAQQKDGGKILVNKRQGPNELVDQSLFFLDQWPTDDIRKKIFTYQYQRDAIQKKVYNEVVHGKRDPFDERVERPCLHLYDDKQHLIDADPTKEYIVDYYYEYTDDALIYTVQKERFNGLFTLQGKFYSKDENDGINYTNLFYMPKVRVVSGINLRLGERADPSVATFNIIGMPQTTVYGKKGLILEITRLNMDIDEQI